MNLTATLKKFCVDTLAVKANATDDEFRSAIGKAIAEGTLTMTKLTELTSTKADNEADEFNKTLNGLSEALGELKDILIEDRKSVEADDEDEVDETKSVKAGKKGKKPPFAEADAEEEEDEEEEKKSVKKASKPDEEKAVQPSAFEKMMTRFGGIPETDEDGKSVNVRVKGAIEMYDDTKSVMTFPSHTEKGRAHPQAGKPVKDFSDGHTIDNPSERDKAVAGAYAQFMTASASRKSRSLGWMALPQHSKELLMHAMEHMKWGGATDGGDTADIKGRKLTPHEQKALIDDSTSGGLEAAPIVFDDQVISAPLLNGELYPLVNTIPLDRGRRVEGVATGTVTGSWGGVDDTDIALFSTTSFVTAFDTTIFRWEGAIRVGLDFLSDTPIDFGQYLTAQYGERLLEDLDDVIATGSGSTQPEGISVKAGTTSVSFGGTTSIGNYESLRFGVPKNEHRQNLMNSIVFCGSETSYQRAMAIPVGASDARRLSNVISMPNYDGYTWMGRPYKINESLGNTKIFYAVLARYRMYRRRGMTMRTSTEGDTLIRKNEMLLVATARYGGQLERGACAAYTSTAPA